MSYPKTKDALEYPVQKLDRILGKEQLEIYFLRKLIEKRRE